jgi:hypothetical protein
VSWDRLAVSTDTHLILSRLPFFLLNFRGPEFFVRAYFDKQRCPLEKFFFLILASFTCVESQGL